MAVQFNPVQSSVTNPFEQRRDDQQKDLRTQDESKNRTEVRPTGVSASESQGTETRNTQSRENTAQTSQRDDDQSQSGRRGSLIDVSV